MDCFFRLPINGTIWAIMISAQNPRKPHTIGSDGMLLPSAAAKAGMAVAASMLETIVIFVNADDMACSPSVSLTRGSWFD